MKHLLVRFCAVLVALPIGARVLEAQSTTAGADTEQWCRDATTLCWAEERRSFAGLRFVFEPQLGVLFQTGDNKFDQTNFGSLEKLGLATSLVGSKVGLQMLLIYPSAVEFDEQSPVRVNNQLVDEVKGKVDVEWGLTAGVTIFDGILSVGWGMLHFDRRDFKNPDTLKSSVFRDSFLYFNLQGIEALKGAIKGLKKS